MAGRVHVPEKPIHTAGRVYNIGHSDILVDYLCYYKLLRVRVRV